MATPLKLMRQEFKKLKWALYAVIFVFVALIFVNWGMGTDNPVKRGDFVAMVDNERVTYRDFIRAYEQQREMLRQFYKDKFSDEYLKGMEERILNNLVEEKVLKKQASSIGLNVSKDELKKEILKIPAFKREDGSFVGYEIYKNILAANQFTPKQFEEDVKEDILKNRYRRLLTELIYISEEDLIEEYKKRNMSLTTDYVFLSISNLEPQVNLDENEVRVYYEKIKDQFWQPEKRKISYLLVDFSKIKTQIKVSDEEIKSYYESNTGEFERQEEVKARHILIKTEDKGEEKAKKVSYEILEKLKKGEDFAKLAREFSEDPGSKDTGGDLGYFGRGQMVPEFEEVSFSLEVGEFSEPVKTPFGYHIIQVLDHRIGGTKPLEEVRNEIYSKILQEKAEIESSSKAKTLHKKILEEAPKKPEDLQKYTEVDPNITLNTTNYFSLQDFIQGLGRVPELNNAVFSLKKGGISPPVKTNRGYVIAYLEDTKEQGISPFADVKDQVEKRLKGEKAKKIAEEKIKELQNLPLEEIAEKLKLTVSRDQNIRYLSPIPNLGSKKSLHENLFSYPSGTQTPPLEGQNGWAIFRITKKDEYKKEDFEAKKEEIRKSLKQNLSIQYVDILKNKARDERSVVINPNFLKKT